MRGREGLPEQQPFHCWEIWKMSTWPGGIFDIKSNCQKVSHSNRKRRNVGKLWNWSSKKWKLEVFETRTDEWFASAPAQRGTQKKSVEFRPRAKVVHVDVVGRSRSFEFCSSRPPIGSAGDVPRWRGWFSFFDLFDARVSATNWRRGGGCYVAQCEQFVANRSDMTDAVGGFFVGRMSGLCVCDSSL